MRIIIEQDGTEKLTYWDSKIIIPAGWINIADKAQVETIEEISSVPLDKIVSCFERVDDWLAEDETWNNELDGYDRADIAAEVWLKLKGEILGEDSN